MLEERAVETSFEIGKLTVELAYVTQQVIGQVLAMLGDQGGGPDGAKGAGGAGRGQFSVEATGLEVADQRVQLVRGAGPLGDHVVAAFGEHVDHGRDVLDEHRVQLLGVASGAGGGGRVDRVGLASPPAAELTDTGGQE